MKNVGPQFSLFNRIAVFSMSCLILVAIAHGVTTPSVRQSLDVVTGFLFVAFAAMGCGGIWFSLAWRPRTESDVVASSRVDRSAIPHDAIACRFSSGFANTKSGAVIVDPKQGVIHFENCHVPRRFLAMAEPWFTCPLSDVRGVHRFQYRGESLTIVTTKGKALVLATASDYSRLCEYLLKAIPENQPGFATDHPMMGMVYLAGALIGMFGGFALTTNRTSNTTFGLIFVFGSVLGVAGSHFLIFCADRLLKTNLARPIGGGMIGATGAVIIGGFLGPQLQWEIAPLLVLVGAGAVIGGIIGVLR